MNCGRNTAAYLVEYETAYLATANQLLMPHDEVGNPRFAPTFEDDQGLNGTWKGKRYVVEPGVLNIYDELVVKELKIRGGWYELMHLPADCPATDEDYVEFSVVDKDDVTGLFALFGLEVGVDVIEFGKFPETDYVNKYAAATRQMFRVNGAKDIIPGLYLRTYYMSMGSEGLLVKRVVQVHESD